MKDPSEVLLTALCAHGLKMRPSELSQRERKRQVKILTGLFEEYGAAAVYYAIRDGMTGVWPFSDGRPFDADDLSKNILKARSVASDQQRRGESYHQLLPEG